MLSTRIKMECGKRRLLATLHKMAHRGQTTAAAPKALPKSESNNAEYTDEAIYPEIQDLAFRARKKREVENWYEQIRKVPTVEEKIIKMNMPRYYGYKVVNLNESTVPYNALPAMQHYTRTIFEDIKVDTKASPEGYSTPASHADVQEHDAYMKSIKDELKDAIEFTHHYFNYQYGGKSEIEPQQREQILTRLIVEQVNRTLINVLSPDFLHLQESDIDYKPRHEAFWAVGGIHPPKNIKKSKEGHKWQKEMSNDPHDRFMQYTGRPYLTLRHRNQLSPWKTEEESTNSDLGKTIPRFNYDPRALGYVCGQQHLTSIPGFWPGCRSGFGSISYQSRAFLQIRPDSYGLEDFKEALHAQAIQTSYAWLLALASYNGFNTFNDITYPMNTQTIVTNGRDWSFYEYQLNTLLVHSNHVDDNPRVNFCRGTPELQLYSSISETGEALNFNEDVLRHIVRFYTNVPTIKRSTNELQPYLGTDVKYVADYKNDEQSEFLEKRFKHLMENRPRHLPIPEIYLWEKIYKIDNKTRPMEAKRRYFELGINPWKRTLDQHQKEYIPKALRPEGPKSKKKWKQTYYP